MRYIYYSNLGGVQGFSTVYEVAEGEDPMAIFASKSPYLLKNPDRRWVACEPFENWVAWGRPSATEDVLNRIKLLNSAAPVTTVLRQPGPRKPAPAIPPEAHSTAPFDAEAAMEAVRALCKGG
jgi:hypothetical protein